MHKIGGSQGLILDERTQLKNERFEFESVISVGDCDQTELRGVQAGEVETPAMAAEAGRETRRGAESDEESDGCDGAHDSARVRIRNTY